MMDLMDLIALLPQPLVAPLPDGVVGLDHAGWTAIVAPRPSRFLPILSRAAALEEGLARQRLLEALMRSGDVLPVAAGTRVQPADLAQILALNQGALTEALAGIEQRMQYQLILTWDLPGVLEKFRASPEIAPLLAAGRTTPADLAGAVGRLADRLRAEIAGLLAPLAAATVEMPRTEAVLFNQALLIERSEAYALDQVLERIDALWPEGFRLRLIGPSPAVSFALLSLVWFSAQDVADAARLLGIGVRRSFPLIEEQRRRCLRLQSAPPESVNAAARLMFHALAGTVGGRVPVMRAAGQAEIRTLMEKVA